MTERIGDAMFRALDGHEAARLLGGMAAISQPPSTVIPIYTYYLDGTMKMDGYTAD
jgi:hypothetical protein